jgi:hypothetical protein
MEAIASSTTLSKYPKKWYYNPHVIQVFGVLLITNNCIVVFN